MTDPVHFLFPECLLSDCTAQSMSGILPQGDRPTSLCRISYAWLGVHSQSSVMSARRVSQALADGLSPTHIALTYFLTHCPDGLRMKFPGLVLSMAVLPASISTASSLVEFRRAISSYMWRRFWLTSLTKAWTSADAPGCTMPR